MYLDDRELLPLSHALFDAWLDARMRLLR